MLNCAISEINATSDLDGIPNSFVLMIVQSVDCCTYMKVYTLDN